MSGQKFTVKQVVDALRKTHGTISHAAELLGCEDDTIQNYRKRYKAVNRVIMHYRKRRVDTAELKLDEALLAGAPWAVALVLRTLGKKRGYVERIEQTGKDGGAIEIKTFRYGAAIAGIAPRSMEDSEPSGEVEGNLHGQTLGENVDGG